MAEVPEADLEFTSKLLARYDWDVYLAVGTLKMQLQACSSQDAANVAKKAAQESASSAKEVDGYKGLSSERSVVLAERNVEQRCEENSSGGAGTAKKPSLPPGSTSRK